MGEDYFVVIACLHLSFASVLYFLDRRWPSRFLRYFALAWGIEFLRAVFLLGSLHLEASGDWFLVFDASYVVVTCLILAATADFVGRRLTRRPIGVCLGIGFGIVLVLPVLLGLASAGGLGFGKALEEWLIGPSCLHVFGAGIRLLAAWWLYRYWQKEALPGAGVAGFFMTLHALGSLSVPVELWFFDGAMPGGQLFWFIQVLGLSIGIITLVVNRQHAQLTASQRAAGDSLTRLAAILDTAVEGIFAAEPDGTIVLVNRQAETLFGFPSSELIGQNCRSLLRLRGESSFELPTLRLQGTVDRMDGLRRDGSTFPLQLRVGEAQLEGGVLYTAAVKDLTRELAADEQRRLLEQQFQHAQKMEAIGRLSAGIAHDFNNLLTTIQLSADLALRRLRRETVERSYVAEIRNAAQSAALLTSQLLAFSRRQILRSRVIDLGEVVSSLSGMLRRLLGEDIRLHVTAEQSCWVEVDRGQIEQVVMNLAVNSRDAMPKGGSLTIETRFVTLGKALEYESFVIPNGDYVTLSVSDSGIGMNEETRDRIFEPFFTTKEVGKGTGLGMSTVYGIVKQSDGYVVVESQPGRGTVCTIYLKRVEDPAEAAAEGDHGPQEKILGRVVVVDDQPVIRSAVARVLKEAGYSVQELEAAQVSRLLNSVDDEFDVILLDIVMPGHSGIELAAQVRDARPDASIVFMTGYLEGEAAGTVLEYPDNILLRKPFAAKTLIAMVSRAIRRKRDGSAPSS